LLLVVLLLMLLLLVLPVLPSGLVLEAVCLW